MNEWFDYGGLYNSQAEWADAMLDRYLADTVIVILQDGNAQNAFEDALVAALVCHA